MSFLIWTIFSCWK